MSATITLCLAETQRLAEWWDSFTVHIGDHLGYAPMESCSGSLQWANYRVSASYVIGFRSIFGFLRLFLSWKWRHVLEKLVLLSKSRLLWVDHRGGVVWLPGLVAAAEIEGQSSRIRHGLAIVCLYSQALISKTQDL